jgi:antitoxin VapB
VAARPAPETWSEPPARRAKLFWNGRSQAVRLPREFRFAGDEVTIRREGDRVILEPVASGWPPGYFERLRQMSRYFRDFKVEPLPPGGTAVDFDAP